MNIIQISAVGERDTKVSIRVGWSAKDIDFLIKRLQWLTWDREATSFSIDVTATLVTHILDNARDIEILSLRWVPEWLRAFHTRCLSYFWSGTKQKAQIWLINLYKEFSVSNPNTLREIILDEEGFWLYEEIESFWHTGMCWVILSLMREFVQKDTWKFPDDIGKYIPNLGFSDTSIKENIRTAVQMWYPRKKNVAILRILLGKWIHITKEEIELKRRATS